MGSSSDDGSSDADRADVWRADIIADFRLRSAERCAAASPSAGFPQILDSVLSSLSKAPPGPWIELGGGLGGAASWIARSTGHDVDVFDPSLTRLRAARRLFPELRVACSDVEHLPIRDAGVAVAFVGGLVSLLDDVSALLTEAARIVAPRGSVVVTDLWAPDRATSRIGPNTFRSLEDFLACADDAGLGPTHLAVADVSTGWWPSAADQIDDELAVRHGHEPSFDVWDRHHRTLHHVLEDGLAVPAGVVLVRD